LVAATDPKGLTDVLYGKEELGKVIRQTEVSGLSVLPLGMLPSNPGILLSSGKMREIMLTLEQQYDVLIFDCASLLVRNDAVILARQADALVLVARSRATTRPALARVDLLLQRSSVKPAGIVLTEVCKDEYRSMLPLFSMPALFRKPYA
jgi:Mrp family chromosome partitioning ATPase